MGPHIRVGLLVTAMLDNILADHGSADGSRSSFLPAACNLWWKRLILLFYIYAFQRRRSVYMILRQLLPRHDIWIEMVGNNVSQEGTSRSYGLETRY